MKTLRISEVAERTGVPATTLRYYEDIGLIGPAVRAANGYRNYNERDLERLAVITRAKKLDISLDDVRELLTAWESDECGSVQNQLAGIVTARLQETHQRIAELTGLADQLAQARTRLLAGEPQDGACTTDCACATDQEPQPSLPGGVALLPLAPVASDAMDACTLERHVLPARLAQWAILTAEATGRTALADGVALDFSLDPELAARVARLAAEEQQCCSFFDFTLGVNASGLRLEVRAPDRARDALFTVFGAAA